MFISLQQQFLVAYIGKTKVVLSLWFGTDEATWSQQEVKSQAPPAALTAPPPPLSLPAPPPAPAILISCLYG